MNKDTPLKTFNTIIPMAFHYDTLLEVKTLDDFKALNFKWYIDNSIVEGFFLLKLFRMTSVHNADYFPTGVENALTPVIKEIRNGTRVEATEAEIAIFLLERT